MISKWTRQALYSYGVFVMFQLMKKSWNYIYNSKYWNRKSWSNLKRKGKFIIILNTNFRVAVGGKKRKLTWEVANFFLPKDGSVSISMRIRTGKRHYCVLMVFHLKKIIKSILCWICFICIWQLFVG